MSGSNNSGCVSILNQQQRQVIEHHNQCGDRQCSGQPKNSCDQPQPKKCTVVENGRVVVKFIAEPGQSGCTE